MPRTATMSDLIVDSQSAISSDCGCPCCSDASFLTPETIYDRPGLSSIANRVGTFASFRQTMLDAISTEPGLAGWTTRQSDDFGIALIEMWAYLADILTFYQERIANEAYLRTAVNRDTVLRLASMLDYKLSPGKAAKTWLAFFAEKGATVQIPAGFRVQSVPGQDEKPQKFESSFVLSADERLNRRRIFPYPSLRDPLGSGSSGGILVSGEENLKPGDDLVLFSASDTANATVPAVEEKRIEAIQRTDAGIRLTWSPEVLSEHLKCWRFVRRCGLFGQSAPLSYLYSYIDANGNVKVEEIREGDLKKIGDRNVDFTLDLPAGSTLCLDSVHDELKPGAQILVSTQGVPGVAGSLDWTRAEALYRLCNGGVRDHFYTTGLSERDKSILENGYVYEGVVGYVFRDPVEGSTELYRLYSSEKSGGHDHFYTTSPDEWQDSIEAGTYTNEGVECHVFRESSQGMVQVFRLLLSDGGVTDHFLTTDHEEGLRAHELYKYDWERNDFYIFPHSCNANILTTVTGVRRVQKQKGPLSATVTEITVRDLLPPIENVRNVDIYELAGSEVKLRNLEYPESLAIGSKILVLPLDQPCNMPLGRELLLDDATESPERAVVSGTVPVDADEDGKSDHLGVEFDPQLARSLDSSSAFCCGNVIEATHGETVKNEILGSGDGSQEFQEFTLQKSPVTFIADPQSPHGVSSTLQVLVGGLIWSEVESFYGYGPKDHIYTTRIDDAGKMTVRFGDGRTGARLPAGSNNVTASYRYGLGKDGNVRADTLKTLLDHPVGLKSVTNPIPAEGGTPAETLDQARTNAPNTVRTFERAISLRDYEDIARSYVGIAKAKASNDMDENGNDVVSLTIAGDRGATIAKGSAVYKDFVAFLDLHRDVNQLVTVEEHIEVPLAAKVAIRVDSPYLVENVAPAVRQALLDYFDFDNLDLGQAINLSDIYAVVQGVRGVTAARVDALCSMASGSLTLDARVPVGPNEIATLATGFPQISSDLSLPIVPKLLPKGLTRFIGPLLKLDSRTKIQRLPMRIR